MRLIYNGTIKDNNTCTGNGSNTESSALTYQKYSIDWDRSEYVGWTYTLNSQRTLSGTASSAKTQTENWYNDNIGKNTTYASKVADGKFCNDRNVTSETWAGTSSAFSYAAEDRLLNKFQPTLSCNSGDIYILKVGLITADEVIMAGSGNSTNKLYFLYNGDYYWTMTPFNFSSSNHVSQFRVRYDGWLQATGLNNTHSIRPVINLRSDTTFKADGNGTVNSPYIVQ